MMKSLWSLWGHECFDLFSLGQLSWNIAITIKYQLLSCGSVKCFVQRELQHCQKYLRSEASQKSIGHVLFLNIVLRLLLFFMLRDKLSILDVSSVYTRLMPLLEKNICCVLLLTRCFMRHVIWMKQQKEFPVIFFTFMQFNVKFTSQLCFWASVKDWTERGSHFQSKTCVCCLHMSRKRRLVFGYRLSTKSTCLWIVPC